LWKSVCADAKNADSRADEIEYPIEALVEMAIASFWDTEALGFADCKPGRGQ
jgi:hypothetical protein